MKLLSLYIFRKDTPKPYVLTSCHDLSSFSFFQRPTAKEVMLFVSREVVARVPVGGYESYSHKTYVCHVRINYDLAAAVTTDEEYPLRVALELCAAALRAFAAPYAAAAPSLPANQDTVIVAPEVDQLFVKYGNPMEADKILRIQRDLQDTKEILKRDIELLLERGEKVETLVARTNDLSFSSKKFVEKSEELNRCCTIL